MVTCLSEDSGKCVGDADHGSCTKRHVGIELAALPLLRPGHNNARGLTMCETLCVPNYKNIAARNGGTQQAAKLGSGGLKRQTHSRLP